VESAVAHGVKGVDSDGYSAWNRYG